MRGWKRQLRFEGLSSTPNCTDPRLTNIRYADDILLFGKSLSEAVDMLEKLPLVFKSYGLELNMKKRKY
jgi:hypothetical protein